ncbi:hypothetical protein H6F43_08805 [Leptolyngbya sp. FACHB-36]|uniref:hypothetical protein n=1 Tax=Leptolyngbya sp. FACHB-36 TaxID=2692808 RepID=UPI00167FFC6B|nr:hypothetical protein [Leptolyngbya sp. FACHB-36]MBD2020284.1 hypothetical protein [Leptolyngbya sp. FACHB-36]
MAAEEFIDDRADSTPPTASTPAEYKRDRDAVRIILIGSRAGVTQIIQTLYVKEFAQVHEWSPLQPEPITGKQMSVATKRLNLQ